MDTTETPPRPPPLTKQQAAALRVIIKSIRERSQFPTIREICEPLKLSSTNSVVDYLRALVRKGYLKRTAQKKVNRHAPNWLLIRAAGFWYPTWHKDTKGGAPSRDVLADLEGAS